MTKSDVLDDVIELLIRKAVEDERLKLNHKSIGNISRGEKGNGIYSSAHYRKQA